MIYPTEKNVDVVVIVPSWNESRQIRQTLMEVLEFFCNVIVVDDGSTDDTLEKIKDLPIVYLKHPVNLGQGASIQTGISAALNLMNFEYILTFDADGQHSVDTAIQMVNKIRETKVEIILGSRFLFKELEIPKIKRYILRIAIYFTRFTTKLDVTDTHNGLRIFDRCFASNLSLIQNGMSHATEILFAVKKSKANWLEFPTPILYTDYSKKKGQSVLNSINILTELYLK